MSSSIPTPDEVAALIERLRRTNIYLPDSHAYRTLMKDRAEAANALESLRPKPEAGETPECDALIAYHTAESEQLSERVPVADDAAWLAHSVQQIREVLKLTRSLETRLRALRGEREGMVMVPIEPTKEMVQAACSGMFHTTATYPYEQAPDYAKAVWKAMLSARERKE